MKRVSGKVTWECRFEMERSKLVRKGMKSTTVRSGHRVEDGDALRLVDNYGDTMNEVNVLDTHDLLIHADAEGYTVLINGRPVTQKCAEHLAKRDGFRDVCDMVIFFRDKGKMPHGVFDGQIIEW
jgi:hypothetical protein